MKTEEILTPELQPVTWGNRVATVLMIGVVWFFPLAWSGLAGDTWTIGAVFFMATWFGSYASTAFLVVALFKKKKDEQLPLRILSALVMPVTFMMLLAFIDEQKGNEYNLYLGLAIQLTIVLLIFGGNLFSRNKK